MQWYDAYTRYQHAQITQPGEIHSSPIIGVVACYLGLAYALYLLDHNAEIQARLVNRLKDPGNFQGAFYELMIASILIRAGFTLALEDETDPRTKHCEFSATSKATGKKYWVEAKMRSVAGLFGKTTKDGGADDKPFSRFGQHLNGAFSKPATDQRLIFIDLNVPPAFNADGSPKWMKGTLARLEQYENQELPNGASAYVFVTNFSAHRQLDGRPSFAAVFYGLGISDFLKASQLPIIEAYRQKQKHKDAYAIGTSFERHLRFPTTFDGRLPSEAEATHEKSSRVEIGETYFFGEIGDKGVVATVTDAIVDEDKKEIILGVTTQDGNVSIYKKPMSDEEFSEYKLFQESYFGIVRPGPSAPKNDFEMFEWLMMANASLSREEMLSSFKTAPDQEKLSTLSDDELRMAYCNGQLTSLIRSRQKKNVQDN